MSSAVIVIEVANSLSALCRVNADMPGPQSARLRDGDSPARAISHVHRVVSEVRGILEFQSEGNAFSS
jgi:hypothetical protein